MESPDDVIEALAQEPERLIGQPETEWLEFKEQPYWTSGANSPKQKHELAKDVSAMANADGGIIVIGVSTSQDATHQEDVADELRPIPHGLITRRSLEDTIEEWVFPRPEVRIKEHRHPSLGADKSIWSIHIQPGRSRDLPFLVTREYIEGEDRTSQRRLFGLYERLGAHVRSRDPAIVHQWIGVGYRDEQANRERTHSDLTRAITESSAAEDASAELVWKADVDNLITIPNEAYWVVQFVPRGVGRIERFYEGDTDSVFSKLQSLRQLRSNGFNLPWRAPVEPCPQAGYRMTVPHRASLSVLPNGVATAVMAEPLLAWATEKYSPKDKEGKRSAVYINTVALPEFSLESCRFFLETLLPLCGPRRRWDWRTGMGNTSSGLPLALPRGAFGEMLFEKSEPLHAGEDYVDEWTRGDSDDPEIAALLVVKQVYRHFRLGEDFIQLRSGDRTRISTMAITKLGG